MDSTPESSREQVTFPLLRGTRESKEEGAFRLTLALQPGCSHCHFHPCTKVSGWKEKIHDDFLHPLSFASADSPGHFHGSSLRMSLLIKLHWRVADHTSENIIAVQSHVLTTVDRWTSEHPMASLGSFIFS